MIIDTLRRIHSQDENDSGAMSELLGRLERIATTTGCAIVFLHHTTKGSALNGQSDMQQASRGSSVLTDNIRWQSFVAGMTRDEAKTLRVPEEQRARYVRFGISKRNYGVPLGDLWLQRSTGGLLVPADLSFSISPHSTYVRPASRSSRAM